MFPPEARQYGTIEPMARTPSSLDTGWPFLIAGLLLLAAVLLIPAQRSLEATRMQRDRALAVESHRAERLARYERYLAALRARDPGLINALAATQLNSVPSGHEVLLRPAADLDAPIFAALEPPPLRLVEHVGEPSVLERVSTGPRLRPWAIAAGVVLLLLGLLPKADRGS